MSFHFGIFRKGLMWQLRLGFERQDNEIWWEDMVGSKKNVGSVFVGVSGESTLARDGFVAYLDTMRPRSCTTPGP